MTPVIPLSSAEISVAEAIEQRSDAVALTFVDDALRPSRIPGRDLAAFAASAAASLRAAGVSLGDRVCLLAPTSPAMLVTLLGLWRLGAVPVVLAHPRRPDPDRLKATVAERASAVAAAAVVVDRAFAGPLGTAAGGAPVLTLDDVEHGPRSALPPMPHPDDLGLLQFTSGTTAASKIVPVRQGQIVGNIGRCVSALGLTPADTYVSWLPFYHDMGIISVAGLLAHGLHVVVMATETFLRRPAAWMETVSTCQAAITAGPDSGYALAARAQELRPQRLDLSGLRVAINGAEPVSPENVESALRAFGPVGMRPESMCATYGLAEATLVATIQRPAVPPVFLAPDEVRASVGLAPPRRPVASCGHPLDDTLIEIRDETGAPLPDGAVGEIFISGPGVMHGYWRGPRADAGADAPSGVENAWLPTGDLGLLRNGELYVCGRAKDMIIVGGRNLYPEDYERVAERVPGVRPGNVIAFSVPGQERMVVVAEGYGRGGRAAELARAVRERLHAEVEHAPREVLIIRAGTLPKTSSGKRRRRECRDRYLAGALEILHAER